MPGRDAGQKHSQTPSLHQDQLNTSTHFNLADLLWAGRILPSVLPAVRAEPVGWADLPSTSMLHSLSLLDWEGKGGGEGGRNSDYF